MPVTETSLQSRIDAVRRFNRFYTRQIGVLREGLLGSSFSLTEARVIYELARCENTTATGLNETLGLDAAFLSRILHRFEKQGLIGKRPSTDDARKNILWLEKEGQAAFSALDSRSCAEIEAGLNKLPITEQNRLVGAMATVENILAPPPKNNSPYLLRSHQPGDMGWVTWRHGVLYAEEYGWDEQFEALVASITAQFIQCCDAKREHCWIAERHGENVGSVFLVKQSETTAKLRLLLVEPNARGLGIGHHLVDECIRFARRTGYRKITLWTNSVLLTARHIYTAAGFSKIHEAPHHSFGHDLVGETWELTL